MRKPELGTECRAEGPRLAQEGAVELGRSRDEARLYRARRATALNRRIESHLDEILIEQVLAPDFEGPGTIMPSHAHPAIEHREALLGFLDVEIRSGVELANITAGEIDEAAQAFGPQPRRPGDGASDRPLRRIGDTPARKLEQGIVERPAVGANQVVPILG